MNARYGVFVLATLVLSTLSSAQLERQWVARFNAGLKKSLNAPAAMAVDKRGNVIVTGWVTRTSTGVDIATVKYSPDGAQMWVKYYGGSGSDKATAIAVDTGMNIYVTGSKANGSNLDYVTIKYDSLGTELWPAIYAGPSGDDSPVAVAVNDSLNVFVTGWSFAAGSGYDYATVKYNSAGAEQWVKRYNGPAMGTNNGTDSALAMVLSGNSALYVTGTSRDSTFDFFTVKYNPANGDSLWGSRYKGFKNDIARAMILRSSNELYVTGSTQDTAVGYNYLTLRYNQSDGGLVWQSRYNGPTNTDDIARGIGIRNPNRVIVTGRSLQPGSFWDFTTVSYAVADGNEDWVSTYNGTANDDDGAVTMAGGNNPYVLGPSAGTGVGLDYAFVHYNGNNGSEQDVVRYNGVGNGDDVPTAILSANNGVYVTGSSMPGVKGTDWLTIKYVDRNDLKYRTFIQDSLNGKAASLKSSNPNVASVRDTAFRRAFPKIKKGFPGAPGGLVAGNMRPDSAAFYGWIRFDKGSALMKFLPQNGVSYGFDIYDGKLHFGEKKNPKWPKLDNHLVGQIVTMKMNIAASDAEVTPPMLGDLSVTDTASDYDGMTLRQVITVADNYLTYWKKYPLIDWAQLDTLLTRVNRAFAAPPGPLEFVSKVALTVTGVKPVDSVAFLEPGAAPLINPLAFPPEWIETLPGKFALAQNYPNPFNPSTTIEFEVPDEMSVSLAVYDLLGREVAVLLDNEDVEEGSHVVEFDARTLASGIYFYRLLGNEGQFRQMKKMMLVK
jgi:hypothetical protein